MGVLDMVENKQESVRGRFMSPYLMKALQLLGFTTPFVYAAATYFFFHWLDKKASGAAKATLSRWLERRKSSVYAVGPAFVELFDRVYTRPLLGPVAFLRSAAITVIITFVVVYELGPTDDPTDWLRFFAGGWIGLFLALAGNIISDYSSLFIVRWFLTNESTAPIIRAVLGPTLGILAVALVQSVANVMFVSSWFFNSSNVDIPNLFDVISTGIGLFMLPFLVNVDDGSGLFWRAWYFSSILVHFWLPLLALCAYLARLIPYLFHAVSFAQWFIKRGRDHPLDAIGLIASVVVFAIISTLRVVF
jgi:hypothetical protein